MHPGDAFRIGIRLLGMATCLVLAASCATEPTSGDDNTGGHALPVQIAGESYGHTSGDIDGIVTLEANGCWTIDTGEGSQLVIFPRGFRQDEVNGSVLQSFDGSVRIRDGSQIHGVGGVASVVDFPGVPDGFWGSYLGFCGPDQTVVVVFDSITDVNP